MLREGLKFGTSGLRGLVVELVGWPSYAYSLAFLRAQLAAGDVAPGAQVLVGRDLRSSSPQIATACFAAVREAGLVPVDLGEVPTPALALAALADKLPAIMVTGSHIPDDRNGLKFYTPAGEITKPDEAAILAQFEALSEASDPVPASAPAPRARPEALIDYVTRYTDFFDEQALAGQIVGVYQHSSVARDLLVEILEKLGARTIALGRADSFIPVDTEALRPEDVELAGRWARQETLDAIVSTDGDADRPLIADEAGRFLRGDIVGILTARHLDMQTIVTPVTSNSAVETVSDFAHVERTRVGSPYVIAGMEVSADAGRNGIIGFEANGGVLLGSDVAREGRVLAALPTRDAVLPIVSVLAEAVRRGQPVSALAADLGANHAAAHRLKNMPSAQSATLLSQLAEDPAFAARFFAPVGEIAAVNTTDGLRVSLTSGDVVHFRASGNAPELRCYVEASTAARAQELLDWGLKAAADTLAQAGTDA